MLCSPPGFSFHGIFFQARILEWGVISSSRKSSWARTQTHIFCVSCISRWILYHWATWEACVCVYVYVYILYIQHLLLTKHKDWEGGNTKMRKEEIKSSLFTDDIITYIEQLKKLTENIWNQLDECSIFTGYKVNTQKAVTLLYTSNEQVNKTWN